MAPQQQRALAAVIDRLQVALSHVHRIALEAAYLGQASDEQLVELASIPAVGAFIHAVREIAP